MATAVVWRRGLPWPSRLNIQVEDRPGPSTGSPLFASPGLKCSPICFCKAGFLKGPWFFDGQKDVPFPDSRSKPAAMQLSWRQTVHSHPQSPGVVKVSTRP